jgi:hypothetical protein
MTDMTDDRRDEQIRALRESLRALAEAERGVEVSPRVEASLMALWDAEHSAAHAGYRRRPVVWAAAAAAAAGVVLTIAWSPGGHGRPSNQQSPPAMVQRDTTLHPPAATHAAVDPAPEPNLMHIERRSRTPMPATPVERPRETVMLVGGPLLSNERLQIVRMRVDRDTLTSMGLRSVSSPDATMVDIEMLVGEDGVARALRLGM